ETELKNVGRKIQNSDGTGPLQVTTAEWDRFLNQGGEFAKDYTKLHRTHPTIQIAGAAFRMFCDAKDFSEVKKSKPNDAGETAPNLPSFLEVFHAYLTKPKAPVVIREAEEEVARKGKPIGDLLAGKLGDFDGKLTADQIAAIFTRDVFTG